MNLWLKQYIEELEQRRFALDNIYSSNDDCIFYRRQGKADTLDEIINDLKIQLAELQKYS